MSNNTDTDYLLSVLALTLNGNPFSFGKFDDEVSIWEYGRAEHFSELWSSFDLLSRSTDPKRILIIWNQTPADPQFYPVNTVGHVSPLHWAVCAARAAEKCAQLQVSILDLNPVAHRALYICEHYRNSAHDRLPWLKVLEAQDLFETDSEAGAANRRVAEDAARSLKHALFSQPLKRGINPDFFLDKIRQEVTSPLDPENRHALANIVGPLILLGTNAPSRKFLHGVPLLAVLRACDLLRRNSYTAFAGTRSERLERRHEGLRFTLIDDLAEQGWKQWLALSLKSIFKETTAPAIEAIGPDKLDSYVDSVELTLSKQVKDGKHDCRFHGAATGETPIVFLDLRLFSNHDRAREARFYQRVLELWRRLKNQIDAANVEVKTDREKCRLPWPDNISRDERDIEEWCEAVVGNSARVASSDSAKKGHERALSLFARVLAQLDLSMPIVLFSSSTQAQVLRAVKSYANIITAFSKPTHFAGNVEADCLRAESNLTTALKDCLAILDTRKKCGDLLRLLNSQSNCEESCQRDLHVEMFIDETRDKSNSKFAVGGVLAVYQSSSNPDIDADVFDDIAVECGLRYFDCHFLPPRHSSPTLIKVKHDGSEELSHALGRFSSEKKGHLQLGFVRITPTLESAEASGSEFHRRDALDNKFWFALECVIELFVAETLRELQRVLSPRSVTASIYAGTRVIPSADGGDLNYAFGFPVMHFPEGARMRTLSASDIHRIVSRSLERHASHRIKIRRALGATLPYVGQKTSFPGTIVDRRTRRTFSMSVMDTEIPGQAENVGRVDRIIRNSETDTFAFIELPTGEEVYSHRKYWDIPEPGTLKSNDYVELRDIKSVKSRLRARIAGRIEVNERERRIKDKFLLRKSIRELEEVRPDFRALHYIADQVLSEGVSAYGSSFQPSGQLGQFDEELEDQLLGSIQASRALDGGDLVGAILNFSFIDLDPNRQSARSMIGRRIARHLPYLRGHDFVKLLATGSSKGRSGNKKQIRRVSGPSRATNR